MSKRAKIKKSSRRTPQFSSELHCQAPNQRRTELIRGVFSTSMGFGVERRPKDRVKTGWLYGYLYRLMFFHLFRLFKKKRRKVLGKPDMHVPE
jgi:hypothetical protein